MPIYFSWFITALLSVSGDADNHNLPQSGRLFILREIASDITSIDPKYAALCKRLRLALPRTRLPDGGGGCTKRSENRIFRDQVTNLIGAAGAHGQLTAGQNDEEFFATVSAHDI